MVIPNPIHVQVPMRDGTTLAGDLYLPRDGAFPTLLCKTPYDRTRPAVYGEIAAFLDSDYAVLIVSFRGRFGSGGVANELETEGWGEHPDGYDTIEWAATQPWSSGDVGVYGISADGFWQLTTAATRPPHLKAAFAAYAAHPRAGLMDGGVYTSVGPRWHAMTGMFNVELSNLDDWYAWLRQWRDTQAPQLMSFMHRGLIDVFQHPENDDFWRGFDPGERYEDFEIPVLYECGWYDRYTASQFTHFLGVRERSRSEHARKHQMLVCGPWVHGGNLAPPTSHVTFPESARSKRIELQVRWFDHWLKGVENGIDHEPRLQLFMTGAGEWLEGDTWPFADTTERTLYLAAGSGAADGSLNSGALRAEAPSDDEAADTFTHDPYDPVPTIGGHGGVTWMWPSGPRDQRPAEERSLTYTTERLRDALDVVGEPVARLFVSTTAVDTDVIVTLADVHPDGYSEIVRQAALRGRHRGGPETTELMEPGRVYVLTVPMTPVVHRFRAGHRLRIALASSSFPNFLPNAGVAEPPYLATAGVVAENTVYHDASRPSELRLRVRGT